MKKIIILIMLLIGTYAGAQELRNDNLLDRQIESITIHHEYSNQNRMEIYVVNIKYLVAKYSRHEFATKKERRRFVKAAKKQQASIKTIIASKK